MRTPGRACDAGAGLRMRGAGTALFRCDCEGILESLSILPHRQGAKPKGVLKPKADKTPVRPVPAAQKQNP